MSTTQQSPADYGLAGRSAHLAIPSIVGPILAAILVFNRVYWRIELLNAVAWDDACILGALIFLFGMCLVNLVAVNHGYGRPSSTLSPENIRMALQMFYLNQIFYKLSIGLTKLSILALYLRIFLSQPWFRRTCHVCSGVVIFYTVASTFVTIFQCIPVSYAWEKGIPSNTIGTGNGSCINNKSFWYANALYNILTDLLLLLTIPFVIWSLCLPSRQRWALTLVFGLGVFVFATSVLRFTTLDFAASAEDPVAGTLVSTLWTTIESCIAVVAACLPMVRTPLSRIWPSLFGRSMRAKDSADQNPGTNLTSTTVVDDEETGRGSRSTNGTAAAVASHSLPHLPQPQHEDQPSPFQSPSKPNQHEAKYTVLQALRNTSSMKNTSATASFAPQSEVSKKVKKIRERRSLSQDPLPPPPPPPSPLPRASFMVGGYRAPPNTPDGGI